MSHLYGPINEKHLRNVRYSSLIIYLHMNIQIFNDVEKSLQFFADKYCELINIDQIRTEETTDYARLVHWKPSHNYRPLIICLDGSYIYTNKISNNDKNHKDYWCEQKKRTLIKTMTVCTSTGKSLFAGKFWPGKTSDEVILEELLSGNTPEFNQIFQLLKDEPVHLIVDNGFRQTGSHQDEDNTEPPLTRKNKKKDRKRAFNRKIMLFEDRQKADPTFFPNLKIFRPAGAWNKNDPDQKKALDDSRRQVTSIRFIVENFHAW